MRFYAQYDAAGALTGIGTGLGGAEITEAEYGALRAAIADKASWVDAVHAGRAAIDDVPAEFRTEIAQRVADRHAAQQDAGATEADYLAALSRLGVQQ